MFLITEETKIFFTVNQITHLTARKTLDFSESLLIIVEKVEILK